MNGTRVKKSGTDDPGHSSATGDSDSGASGPRSKANGNVGEKAEDEDEGDAPSCVSESAVANSTTLLSSPLPRPKLDSSRSPTGPMRTGFQRTRGGSLDEDDTAAQGGNDGATAVAVGNRSLLEGQVKTYGWSGVNTYFQYSDDAGIGMGGGGGSFGLFVGDDLLSGTTGA